VIPIFGEPAEMKKKVMGIVTDSKGVADPKDPETSVIYQLYQLVAAETEAKSMHEAFLKGGMGYGDAKKLLLAKLEETFGGERREKRKKMDERPELVEDVLLEGAKKVRQIVAPTMQQVYEAVGIPVSKIKKRLLE